MPRPVLDRRPEGAEPVRDSGASGSAKVFISYSRKDLAFVERLDAALRERGVEPLIDRSEIYAFEDWWKRIQGLVSQADTVVFVLSPDSVASEVCRTEVAFAQTLNKRFAPVVAHRVDPARVPEELSRLNFVFLDSEAGFETGIGRLVEALGTNIHWVRRHSEYGALARRWTEADRPTALLLRSQPLDEAERWIAGRPASAPVPTDDTQAFVSGSRRAATRRRNLLSAGLAVGLVLALALAGLAYWQRQEAIAQREIAQQQTDLAQRELGAAKNAVDGIIFDIAQGLRDVAGVKAATIRRILTTVQGTVDQLVSTAPDDLGLKRSHAVMMTNFVTTYLRVGDTDAALRAGADAVRLARAYQAASPGDGDARRVLGLALVQSGASRARAGDTAAALAALEEAIGIDRELVTADPKAPRTVRDLIAGLERLGDVKQQTGGLEAATAAYEEALGLGRQLVARDPGDRVARRDVALQLDRLGDLELDRSRIEAALVRFNEGLAIRRQLQDEDPGSREAERDLSLGLERIGRAKTIAGDTAGATAAYLGALALRRRLAEGDPSDVEIERDLLATLSQLADAQIVSGEAQAGARHYQDALAVARRIAELDPGSARAQRDVLTVLWKVGNAHLLAGRTDDAQAALSESLSLARALARRNPDDDRARSDLAQALGGVGGVKLARSDGSGAIPLLREAVTIARDLATRQRTTAARRALISVLVSLGNAELLTSERGTAAEAFGEALVLARANMAENANDRLNLLALASALMAGFATDPNPRERMNEVLAILEKLEAMGALPRSAYDILAKLRAVRGAGGATP